MPRFFFDFHNGKLVPDHIGTELNDVEAARREAACTLGEFAKDALRAGRALDVKMHVREESGPVLFTAKLVFEWC